MKNTVKAGIYAAAGSTLLALNSVNAAGFGEQNVQQNVKFTDKTVDTAAQDIVGNFMLFLAIIAVLYLLWWGFNILTAAGDEEKVKKWKTIIIQAAGGLVVIFLANSIVQFVIELITASA